MSQPIIIDRNKLMNLVKVVSIGVLIFTLAFVAMGVGDWLKQKWSSLKPPIIATIDTQKLLTEKAAHLKDRLTNAHTESEQQAILSELANYGEQIALWVKVRAPALCGCIESTTLSKGDYSDLISNNCAGQCIVLNQQSVIAGSTVDLTQAFLLEQAKP